MEVAVINIFEIFGSIGLKDEGFAKGIGEATEKGSSFGEKFGKVAEGVGKAVVGISTAAVSVATALGGVAMKSAEAGDRVDKMSQKLGLTREGFQEWDYILAQNGASIDSFGVGMKTLQTKMEESTSSNAENKAAIEELTSAYKAGEISSKDYEKQLAKLSEKSDKGSELFDKLGISLEAISKATPEEAMELVIQKLQEMPEGAEKTRLALDAFGKQGMELMPMLNQTAEGTEELRQRAHELGMILSDEAVDAGVVFGDTLDDVKKMLGGLANSMGADLLPAMTQGLEAFIGFVQGTEGAEEKLQGAMDGMVAAITEIIPKFVEKGAGIILALLNGLVSALPSLVDGVMQTIPTIITALLGMLPELLEAGVQIIASIISGIAEALPTLIPVAVETLLTLVSSLIDNIDLLIDAALQLIMGLSEGIIAALPILIEKAPEIISKLVVGIIKALPQIWDAAGNIVQMLINGIWDMLPSLMTIGFDIIEQLAAAFGIDLSPILDVGRNIIKGLWDGISSVGRWLTDNFFGFFKDIVSGIKSLLGIRSPSTVFSEMGGNLIKGLWEGINALVSWIRNNVINFFTGIIDSVKDFPKKFIDIGTNMIKGLWQGIQDVSGWLWDKISGFFGGVVDKIKDFFGIASPSKMFAGFGKNIGQGFANGVLAMADTVSGAMDDVFGRFDRSIDVTPKLGRISTSLTSNAVQAGASGAQGRTAAAPGGIQLGPNYFYINSELDIQRISNQLARQTETAMRGRGIVTA